MGFWDDLSNGLDRVGRRINDFGEDAARATREFSQQQKLRTQIADEKRVINTQYLKLGKKYFREHQGDADLDGEASEMVGKIVRAQKNIEEYEEEIARLKESGDAARAAAAEEDEAEEAARAAAAEAGEAEEAARAAAKEQGQEGSDAGEEPAGSAVADDDAFVPEDGKE